MKYRLIFIGLALALGSKMTAQAEMPKATFGKIERHSDFPSAFITPRNIDVWLPEGYTNEEEYAVLYMHDGQMLFDAKITWNKQAWDAENTMQRLLDSAVVRKTIIVGIHNISKERHSDYFPQKPFEKLPPKTQDSVLAISNGDWKLFEKPVQSDNYLKFLVEELIPFVNKTYSVSTGLEHTFIAGSSMGGLISWYALCEYPDVFGGAACLSSHWPGIFTMENNPIPQAFFAYLDHNLPKPGKHKIYFDYGTETLDALYPPLQQQVDTLMANKGYNDNNWKTGRFDGEDHSENAWSKRLYIPLIFLLGK